jgi:AmmeMemoRadiSam system protein A
MGCSARFAEFQVGLCKFPARSSRNGDQHDHAGHDSEDWRVMPGKVLSGGDDHLEPPAGQQVALYLTRIHLRRYNVLVQLQEHHHRWLLNLARIVIQRQLGLEDVLLPPVPADDPHLAAPAGCFVSLHKRETHQLRGCVGRIDAKGPVHEAVLSAAQSVLEDPRFVTNPVMLSELSELELEISLVSPLKEALHPLDFDPQIDGIYLTIQNRSGCFLPQVARETGWAKEHLLSRLCSEKLGLTAMAWSRPGARLQTFQTLIIGPATFELEATPEFPAAEPVEPVSLDDTHVVEAIKDDIFGDEAP